MSVSDRITILLEFSVPDTIENIESVNMLRLDLVLNDGTVLEGKNLNFEPNVLLKQSFNKFHFKSRDIRNSYVSVKYSVSGDFREWGTIDIDTTMINNYNEKIVPTGKLYIAPSVNNVDCEVSNWSNWNSCSTLAPCTTGTQTRERTILTHSENQGTPCPPSSQLTQSKSCGETCSFGSYYSGKTYSRLSDWSTTSFTTAKNRCMSTRGCTGIYRYKLSWFPISTYYLGSGSILSAPSILKSYFRAYPMNKISI
tara:strand:- start:656 stop:1417 length:762 start_codon:yes stop_codon:yes gene_type:complete